jgi:hypothetical protein
MQAPIVSFVMTAGPRQDDRMSPCRHIATNSIWLDISMSC